MLLKIEKIKNNSFKNNSTYLKMRERNRQAQFYHGLIQSKDFNLGKYLSNSYNRNDTGCPCKFPVSEVTKKNKNKSKNFYF